MTFLPIDLSSFDPDARRMYMALAALAARAMDLDPCDPTPETTELSQCLHRLGDGLIRIGDHVRLPPDSHDADGVFELKSVSADGSCYIEFVGRRSGLVTTMDRLTKVPVARAAERRAKR